MLSGVGPAEHISSMGIQVVADLPGVGSGLKDHPVVDLNYMDKKKETLSFLRPTGLVSGALFVKSALQRILTGKGPCTTNVSSLLKVSEFLPRIF